jgi:predicted RND superfamily exporter protein
MDFSKFERPNPENSQEDMKVKHIETENQFWLWLGDSKNQFVPIRYKSHNEDISDKELVSISRGYKYLTHRELLEQQGKSLSEKIQNNRNVQAVFRFYDDIISRLKIFKNRKELNQIFEEIDELIQRFDLGIDK